MKPLLVSVLLVAAASAFALRPALAEHWAMWATLLVVNLGLATWGALELRAREVLRARLKPRGGDLSLGILLGLAMVTAGVIGQRWLAPAGSPSYAWLFGIYAQVGNLQASPLLLTCLGVLAIAEEVVWRGMVLETVSDATGPRWAVPLSALGYALAHTPTLFTLSSDTAGPNPLLFLASLGCGLVFGFVTLALGRLWPVIVAHVVFTYFMAAPLPSWIP